MKGTMRVGGYYGRFANGGELKFFDVDVDDVTIAATGAISTSLNLIPQGTTESTRIGRKCRIKQILWHAAVRLPATATAASSSDICRIILVLDKQANGAIPGAVTDILETANYLSFRNLANSGRFVFLFDRTMGIAAPGGSGRGSTDTLQFSQLDKHLHFFKSCSIPVEFDNTTGAITEIRSNNLILLTISKVGVASLDSHFRLRFSDS